MPRHFSSVFDPASPQATAISSLFIQVLVICGIILLVVIGMVGLGVVRYRRRPGQGEPRPFFGNRKLEIFWTAVPMLIVGWLLVLTARAMTQSDPPADQTPDLIVIGHQWWWEVRYPKTGVVTANEIHLPVGQKWLVRLESADVIHDFWVPALARKIDVVPGRTNHLWLEAASPGTYAGTCAEFCGAQHAWMRFSVVAESPAEFATWVHGQETAAAAPVTDSARAGQEIFYTKTCINCHSIGGVSVAAGSAPDLTHLAGRAALGAGVLDNTPANLFRWLKNPQVVKPACLMPNLNLTDAQAGALVSYLETLK